MNKIIYLIIILLFFIIIKICGSYKYKGGKKCIIKKNDKFIIYN